MIVPDEQQIENIVATSRGTVCRWYQSVVCGVWSALFHTLPQPMVWSAK